MGGRYEVHVTIAQREPCDRARVEAVGDAAGARAVHIVLDAGAHRSQPMLTARAGPALSDAHEAARRLVAALAREGIDVARVKIEGDLDCVELVEDEDGLAASRAGRYFEHHTKVLLRDEPERRAAEAIAARHGARASRNAFARDDRGEARFLTLRQRDVRRALAASRARSLDDALLDAGIVVLSSQSEYVVFDSNLALDHRWSPAGYDEAATTADGETTW
jgi:hypothetical protein